MGTIGERHVSSLKALINDVNWYHCSGSGTVVVTII